MHHRDGGQGPNRAAPISSTGVTPPHRCVPTRSTSSLPAGYGRCGPADRVSESGGRCRHGADLRGGIRNRIPPTVALRIHRHGVGYVCWLVRGGRLHRAEVTGSNPVASTKDSTGQRQRPVLPVHVWSLCTELAGGCRDGFELAVRFVQGNRIVVSGSEATVWVEYQSFTIDESLD